MTKKNFTKMNHALTGEGGGGRWGGEPGPSRVVGEN